METNYTLQDFKSDQEVKWCPGCGDYAILTAVQRTLPKLNIKKENVVFVSGIGCSSRFPYYMNTYGFHTIHGRAPSVATGIKLANPDLSVWVVTGDGDGLSIGANHLLHTCRRNVDLNILLFNNEIYGLTKGQVSPTSRKGTVSKTSPEGSLEEPLKPIAVAKTAGAGFIARTLDRDPKHMAEIIEKAAAYRGTSFIEIYQNCVIFNDGAFDTYSDKDLKQNSVIYLEDAKPLIYANGKKGIGLDINCNPYIIEIESAEDILKCYVHYDQAKNPFQVYLYSLLSENPQFPSPFGIFQIEDKISFEENMAKRKDFYKEKALSADLDKLLYSGDYWEVS